jgi:hypothetical protein
MVMNLYKLQEILAAEFGNDLDFGNLLDFARNENTGLCVSCGSIQYNVEPDAQNYKCESCGERRVCGIEMVVLSLRENDGLDHEQENIRLKKQINELLNERSEITKILGIHSGGPSLIEVLEKLYSYAVGWSILVDEGYVDKDCSVVVAVNRLIRKIQKRV